MQIQCILSCQLPDTLTPNTKSQILQISSGRLVQLDTFKQRLEVPGPESLVVVALNDLDEHRRTILERTGEDLQKIAIVIIINQNLQFLQQCQVFLDLQSYYYQY